jgi:hypothetical protein
MGWYGTMSNERAGASLEEIAPEKLAHWRSTVRSFFSTSWAEVQKVIEALEAETDPLPAAAAEVPAPSNPVPPRAAPAAAPNRAGTSRPGKASAPPVGYEREPGSSASTPPRQSSSAAPARSGPPQDARLAELARRIEERLRQSKS